MNYRRDIDGLRAIAVLSVMTFHAHASWLPGGFLGVDVFFVISGFLITSLIRKDLKENRFSLLDFYERRARRILPVLFLVLLATIPAALWFLLPSQLEAFGKGLVATTLFSSNFLFWAETGYFMAEAELNPLLHTWSLAVEEQFYLFFPLLLYALRNQSTKTVMAALVSILAASFVTSLILVEHDPAANFYLLPPRGWELMGGAICALVGSRRSRFAPTLMLTGLILIFGSFALLDRSFAMPSWPTIPVVFGTSLIILFGAESETRIKLLGHPALVGIGLISYSAYLWHVPLFVFARFQFPMGVPFAVLFGLLALTLVLAALSYRFIEKPFRLRGKNAAISKKILTKSIAVFAVAFIAFGTTNLFGVFKPASDTKTIETKLATNFGLHEECEGDFNLSPNCRTAELPQTLLWGDSFAMHLAPALEKGTSWGGLIQHTKSVCAPVPGLAVVTAEYPESWARGCLSFNAKVISWLEEQESVQLVVVSSPFGIIHHELMQSDGVLLRSGQAERVRQSLIDLNVRIKSMGKDLVIVSPPPVTGNDLGHCLATVARTDADPSACDFARADAHPASHFIFDFLKTISPEVPTLFLDHLICPEGICDLMVGDTFIFRDAGHLSIEGSRLLGERADFWGQIHATLERKAISSNGF